MNPGTAPASLLSGVASAPGSGHSLSAEREHPGVYHSSSGGWGGILLDVVWM